MDRGPQTADREVDDRRRSGRQTADRRPQY